MTNVWIGTNAGLALFNPTTEKFTVFKHNPMMTIHYYPIHIYDIKQMKDGKIWICTNMGGVSYIRFYNITPFYFLQKEIDFQNIKATNDNYGLSSPNARCAYQDCYGNIWIGNYRGGIDFISHTQPMFKYSTLYNRNSKRTKLQTSVGNVGYRQSSMARK